jgi:hypothetical protein
LGWGTYINTDAVANNTERKRKEGRSGGWRGFGLSEWMPKHVERARGRERERKVRGEGREERGGRSERNL